MHYPYCIRKILLHAFVNETPGVPPAHAHHDRSSLFEHWFPVTPIHAIVESVVLKKLSRHRYDPPMERKSFKKALLNVRHRVLAEARSTDENAVRGVRSPLRLFCSNVALEKPDVGVAKIVSIVGSRRPEDVEPSFASQGNPVERL